MRVHVTENRSVGGSIPPLGTIGFCSYIMIFSFFRGVRYFPRARAVLRGLPV
jgi:hypothetical protein